MAVQMTGAKPIWFHRRSAKMVDNTYTDRGKYSSAIDVLQLIHISGAVRSLRIIQNSVRSIKRDAKSFRKKLSLIS
jgi:hypothetical protein